MDNKWFKKSAEQGNPSAQSSLGVMFYEGRSIPIDMKKAMHWCKKATKRGDVVAYSTLGMIYTESKKYWKAIKQYNKAIKKNPKYHNAWYNKASAFSLMGKKKSMISSLRKTMP